MQLKIEQIEKRYGSKPILKGISLTASAGECIGLLGVNGCGKSTLLSILAGVLKPDAGHFYLNGQDLLAHANTLATKIGYVPQQPPLMEELTALDNLRLWYCDSVLDLKKELDCGVLAMLGIPEFLSTKVSKMSGGMKKRLSIGCAIANDPPILLLDEPGAALDLLCKERIHNYLKAYKSRGGIIFLATHEEQEINLCDQHYLFTDGRLEPFSYDGNVHHLAGKLAQTTEGEA